MNYGTLLQERVVEPAAPKISWTIMEMEANATKMCLRIVSGSLFGTLSEQAGSMMRVSALPSVASLQHNAAHEF